LSPRRGRQRIVIMKIKLLNRRLLVAALIAAVSLNVAAQQRSTQRVPSVERLRAHIEYLASDKLEGRRTGTAGANLAAEYIAREFSRYGLRRSIGYDTAGMSILEADSPNRYLQKFPYVSGVELGEHNLFYVNPGKADDMAQFRVGEDWMPLGFSSNGKINGAEMVFAGYGISSAELKYDDYSVSSARDRVAIVFAGTPDGDNPHGQFARAGEIRFKAAAASAAGVRALLIIASEEKLKDDRLSRLSYDNAGEAGIPVLVISRPLAQKLLALGSLSDYQAAADARGTNNASLRAPMGLRKLDISTEIWTRKLGSVSSSCHFSPPVAAH